MFWILTVISHSNFDIGYWILDWAFVLILILLNYVCYLVYDCGVKRVGKMPEGCVGGI